MEKTLVVINELEKRGLVEKYAIGGAIAATFYMEAILTYDLDIFISVPHSVGPLVTLSPIYEFLRSHGYVAEHEHVLIEGVPVQFLPAANPLVEEALSTAREVTYGATRTRVFLPEYLLAIMLQTYRPKDKARMVQMLGEAQLDQEQLTRILEKHGLGGKWCEFGRQFGIA